MISIRTLPSTIHGNEFFYYVVTWFHTGRIRPASGSWGSLAALPLCWLLKMLGGPFLMVAFTFATLLLGVWCIRQYASHTRHLDPAEVVIDEVMGMGAAWIFTPANDLLLIILSFIFFRVFDAVKRGPVGWCDKNIKGPWGVMIDDLVAGLMAGLCVLGVDRMIS